MSEETKKCRECQSDIPKKAKRCPNCTADQRSWAGRHPILTVLLVIIGLPIIIGSFSETPATTNSADDTTTTEVVAQSGSEPLESADKVTWQYKTEVDEFSGVAQTYAILNSSNVLEFEFPYSGGSQFTLIIRDLHKGSGEEAMIKVSKGQFMTYDEKINVRFDEGEPVSYNIGGADDGSADVIFIRNAAGFIAKLKASKTMKVEAPFYQEGRQVIYFDTEGFKGLE